MASIGFGAFLIPQVSLFSFFIFPSIFYRFISHLFLWCCPPLLTKPLLSGLLLRRVLKAIVYPVHDFLKFDDPRGLGILPLPT